MAITTRLLILLLLLLIHIFCCVTSSSSSPLYAISVTSINGEKQSLEQYKGKVMLIVNVASECGYTDYNYNQLIKLQQQFSNNLFNILALPCNQYGQQEPHNDSNILSYITNNYNINFNISSKITITGEHASPLYKYLIAESGSVPGWNFCKYLVNQNGSVVQFFHHTQDFQDINQSVIYLLSKMHKS